MIQNPLSLDFVSTAPPEGGSFSFTKKQYLQKKNLALQGEVPLKAAERA